MSFSHFRISIIVPLLLMPLLAHGAITWDDSTNRYTGSITKILGEHTLYVTQGIDVFFGHAIYDCSTDPNITSESESSPGSISVDSSTCGWGSCTINTIQDQCHSPGSALDVSTCIDVTCTAAQTASGCVVNTCARHAICNDSGGYHPHYTRTGCSRTSNLKYLVDGDEFNSSSAYGYTANSQCNPGTPDVPFGSLRVEITRSKVYKWDNEPPFCIRGGTFSNYQNFGTDFIADTTLRNYMLANSGSQDTTLMYKDPATDSEISIIYPGIWTNRDVIGKGKCSDIHSGCDITLSGSFYSLPLTHLSPNFAPRDYTNSANPIIPFIDIAKNINNNPSCPTQIFKLSKLTRECDFTISPTTLSGTIGVGTGKIWFDQLPSSDKLFLSGLIAVPTPGTSPSFDDHIKRLRSLSMSGSNSLSAFKGITPTHDLLYTFVPGSCVYTYDFTGNNYPLIDRIKPTIQVTAQIGSGLTVPDMLFQQEGTATGGVPKINTTTGSYLAGSGTIVVTLVDSGSSTFSTYPTGFNGISGMSGVTIDICRTKTHTGFELNNNCSRLASGVDRPHSIASTGGTVVSQYNPVGIKTTPHTLSYVIDLPDSTVDGIRVAGEYQVYTTVRDIAGNINTGTVVFNVVPEGIDLTRTQFVKYDDPIDEASSHIIYTVSGSNYIPNGSTISPSFANAIDTQTYKMSIFDVYNNPVYNWNLYGFSLTQTGIYLDQVSSIGSGAIFIYASGGILSNSGQTGTTNIDGALKFNLVSYAPGKYKEQFKYSYKNWDRYRNEIGLPNNFIFPNNTSTTPKESTYYHIFTGSTDLYTTNRIDLGTANDVMMSFYTTSSTPNNSLTGFTVSNFLESIVSLSPDDFTITSTGVYNSGFIFSGVTIPHYYPYPSYLSGATGSFTPEQKGNITDFNDIDLKVKAYPYITLTFSGYTTRYYVSDKQDVYGSGISYESGALNRIYVEGLTSTIGKNGYVNMKDSMGANSAETRNSVHKNVALLTRNRTAGGIVNRVKYITGNATSSDLTDASSWDVLIIKGGNLTIGGMYTADNADPAYIPFDNRNYYFNSGATSLASIAHKGIIVLKDDNNGIGGNIYIKPDVRFIGASLFADESIESANYSGDKFNKSNSARTFLLNKQLVIYGSLFSKNTIGGAVRANTSGLYTLPWKNTGVNLDEAVRYDLAFLRMDNFDHDSLPYLNKGHKEFVVVLSDPRNVSNPLPGFLIKQ